MKILIYGECDQYGSGAWCYYETLKEMGHQVDFYSHHTDLGKYDRSFFFKVLRRLNSRKPLFQHLSKHLLGFLERVQILKPQIVIVLKGLLIDKYTIQKIAVNKCWTDRKSVV